MTVPVDKYIKQNGVDFYAGRGFGGTKDKNEIWPKKVQLHIPHIFGLPDKKQYFSCLEESIEYLVRAGKLTVVDRRKLAEYISENEEYKLKYNKLLNVIDSEIRRVETQEQISKIIESEPDLPKMDSGLEPESKVQDLTQIIEVPHVQKKAELVLMTSKKNPQVKRWQKPVRVAKCTEEFEPVRVAKCTEEFAEPVKKSLFQVIKEKILRFLSPKKEG